MKEAMIISRIKSPPYENPVEVLYQGEAVEFSDIPLRFNLGPNAREYYYAVHKIRLKEGGLDIERRDYDLLDILSGNLSGNSCSEINLPFNESSKEGLLKIIRELLEN